MPAEWHGWLHHITDHTGDEASLRYKNHPRRVDKLRCFADRESLSLQLLMLKPKRYGVDHKENLSGEGEEYIYHSKGHALNPGQRDWTSYKSWEPAKTDSQ